MELIQQAVQNISQNTQLPITHTVSQMNFKITKFTYYDELVQLYDSNLYQKLLHKNLFKEQIVIIECQMLPENMYWILWKNYYEIIEFLNQLQPDINKMNSNNKLQYDKNMNNVGAIINQQYSMLKNCLSQGKFSFNQNIVHQFVTFLNLIGQQLFLRKSIPFLYFIQHCISIDKWDVMIHQQVYIYKRPGTVTKIMGIFRKQSYDQSYKQKKQKKAVEKFLTISSDGILISDDHLLLARVQKMLPFTNQMKIKCYLTPDDDFVYQVQSGRIDNFKFNFYKDYNNGINFGIGLGRALQYAGYNFLMGVQVDASDRFSTLDPTDIKYLRTVVNYTTNRFESYAQARSNCNAKMYNDGCGYYEDLYDELMKAEKQVCITGWMITPYFLLKRPGNINDPEYRLDGVLAKLAERGIKIFIIVFMQPAMVVNNDSQHVQKHLQSLHKNIKVYRHPNVAVPQLWSHHEKLVIIDQKIGFMGGLDICYGRWDTPEHRLVQNELVRQNKLWDGQEFNNYRIKDIYQPRIFYQTNLNKDFQPRMPWHDIAVQIRGDVVVDLLRHFVQYWYFVKSQISADPRKIFNNLQQRLSYANSYHQIIQKQYLTTQLKNFSEQTLLDKIGSYKQRMGSFFLGSEERISQLLIQQKPGQNVGNINIQMLRSASEWSIGLDLKKHQCSIHNAYQNLIQNSKSHIYIQNQFFMGLENKIVECLVKRILKAKLNNQKFRVVVVMPLLPGFEGYIGDAASTVLRIQMHWQYQAISRGDNSIFKTLLKSSQFNSEEQIKNYIYFFGLRKAELLNNIPITEIVYVHSKLMIVDDQRTIIGSANINDRSLLGKRDSEIAICVQQKTNESNPLTNQSHSLRKRLFGQHFGLKKNDSIDVLDDKVWTKIVGQAQKNTKIYRRIFGCLPDDEVKRSIQIEEWQNNVADISSWNKLKDQIVGHAVDFPLKCMENQDLTIKMNQKQFLAPQISFT